MAKILRITAKRDGFRRAGIAHRDTAVDHPIDRFTSKEIAALKGEKMLVVQELDATDAPAAAATKGTKGEKGKNGGD